MTVRFGTIALLLLFAAVAAFVWGTSEALPALVASHFDASGSANGFMPRATYRRLMLALLVFVPLLVAFLPTALIGKGGRHVSLPNKDYWLAPERREETIGFIRTHGQVFAAAIAVFMGYVHWLVVLANRAHPPVLSTPAMLGGLAVFLVATMAWALVLVRRFRARD
jgi:uncharacterized membrane protein